MTFIEMIAIWLLSMTGQPVDPSDCARPSTSTEQHEADSESKAETETDKESQTTKSSKSKVWLHGYKKISNGL